MGWIGGGEQLKGFNVFADGIVGVPVFANARARKAQKNRRRCASNSYRDRPGCMPLDDSCLQLRQRLSAQRELGARPDRAGRTAWAAVAEGDWVGVEAGLICTRFTSVPKGGWIVGGLNFVGVDRGGNCRQMKIFDVFVGGIVGVPVFASKQGSSI